MNVWLPCPCHVVAPAILQCLIVPLCSPRGCCVVLAVSECNTAKCYFNAVCPPWEAFDQLRCCVCFRVSLLACSAPWLSGVLSELKPGFLQIVFSRIRRRVHDTNMCKISKILIREIPWNHSGISWMIWGFLAITLALETLGSPSRALKIRIPAENTTKLLSHSFGPLSGWWRHKRITKKAKHSLFLTRPTESTEPKSQMFFFQCKLQDSTSVSRVRIAL